MSYSELSAAVVRECAAWKERCERAEQEVASLRSDRDRLDWLERTLFDKWWNGVIDSGSKTLWRMAGPHRHALQRMVGDTLRAAIDNARQNVEKPNAAA